MCGWLRRSRGAGPIAPYTQARKLLERFVEERMDSKTKSMLKEGEGHGSR